MLLLLLCWSFKSGQESPQRFLLIADHLLVMGDPGCEDDLFGAFLPVENLTERFAVVRQDKDCRRWVKRTPESLLSEPGNGFVSALRSGGASLPSLVVTRGDAPVPYFNNSRLAGPPLGYLSPFKARFVFARRDGAVLIADRERLNTANSRTRMNGWVDEAWLVSWRTRFGLGFPPGERAVSCHAFVVNDENGASRPVQLENPRTEAGYPLFLVLAGEDAQLRVAYGTGPPGPDSHWVLLINQRLYAFKHQQLRKALSALPPEARIAVFLYDTDGVKYSWQFLMDFSTPEVCLAKRWIFKPTVTSHDLAAFVEAVDYILKWPPQSTGRFLVMMEEDDFEEVAVSSESERIRLKLMEREITLIGILERVGHVSKPGFRPWIKSLGGRFLKAENLSHEVLRNTFTLPGPLGEQTSLIYGDGVLEETEQDCLMNLVPFVLMRKKVFERLLVDLRQLSESLLDLPENTPARTMDRLSMVMNNLVGKSLPQNLPVKHFLVKEAGFYFKNSLFQDVPSYLKTSLESPKFRAECRRELERGLALMEAVVAERGILLGEESWDPSSQTYDYEFTEKRMKFFFTDITPGPLKKGPKAYAWIPLTYLP